ncbi:hypothetical protein GQ457_04G028740 [Hibiscus cannabinus]
MVGKQSILSDQEAHGNQNACNDQNALDNQNVAARDDAIQVEKLVLVRGRSIRDNMLLNLDDLKPSIITPKIQAAKFELKPVMFTMLDFIGQFGSSPHEDAGQHVRAFLEVCSSFYQQGVHEDVLKLKLFPYSLRDRARMWLNSASPGSLHSRTNLCQSFLLRYNPPNMNARFRNEITSFRQADDESMYEACDRYNELFQKCPMHGFNDWTQVEIFYEGVNTPTRMMLDVAANGTILDKSTEEAFKILDRLANNNYQFSSYRRELVRRNTEIMTPDQTNAMATQLAELTSIVKTLHKSKETYEVKDGHNSEDSKQTTADMTVFVHNLLQQMVSLYNWTLLALDEMGNRINELEQSINDLKVEMGVEGSPSPLPPPNKTPDEAKQEKGSA